MRVSPQRGGASLASLNGPGSPSASSGVSTPFLVPPHRIRTLSTSASQHSLLAAILRDPDPGAVKMPQLEPQQLFTAAGFPAGTASRIPPASPSPPRPPFSSPRPSRPLLRVTPLTQAQDPPPVPGSISHPEDESVDQENALEASDDWFCLQSPRRGRHD